MRKNERSQDRRSIEREMAHEVTIIERMEPALARLLPEHRRRMSRAIEFFEHQEIIEAMEPLERMDTLAAARELLEMPREFNGEEVGIIALLERSADDQELLEFVSSGSYVAHDISAISRRFGAVTPGDVDIDGLARFADVMKGAWSAEASRRACAKAFDAATAPMCSVEKIDRMMEETIAKYENEAPRELSAFSPELQEIIAHNIFAVELTEGCSVRCTFCAFDAKREVGKSVPLRDIAWLHRRSDGAQFYYYASDPLDYRDGSSASHGNYMDVLKITGLYGSFTSTAYPYSAKDIFPLLVGRLNRLSVSDVNRRRLVREKYIEVTPKGSVIPTDPTLAWSLLATERWRDALYNFGDEKTTFNKSFAGRARVRPHVEGHADGDAVGDSIACRNGVLFGPGKLHNSLRMNATPEFPNGVLETVVTPESVGDGTARILKLIAGNEEIITAEELLKCGVVQATDNSVHSVYQTIDAQSGKRGKFVYKKSPTASVLTHDAERGITSLWRFRYDMTTGRVKKESIVQAEEFTPSTYATRSEKRLQRERTANAHWEASEKREEDKGAFGVVR